MDASYLKDILRPAPTAAEGIPANVAHPFQKSFYTYLTKRAIPKHWYLAAGFGFTLFVYGAVDGLRDDIKKSAYDQKVLSGQPPFTAGGH
mmetsp:Transcript_20102/g.55962  ORF Transcript_20102/g.55962 Transcript_20102/m.55962 type:complete len:90 (-) Transcript_20102:373-642(-)|eukprot:CAMPEP_0202371862 /NCGR_PEP_ID=MMETSP1127-20130417/3181_1 /ASSEMBLY_ACC=CAM_ASM_000462 /TAXON_ID=3047 /ORGANISM="Dunaliella tertiolecta, Strain CCMP1320" /LENGTH=89 /DNA_ID=CAMNT_0048968237 /DNA_START=96 /DNA_END=365 /DNA_ORIENTATION=-